MIVREGTPAELTSGGIGTEIRYRRDGEIIVERTDDPTRRLHELTAEALARDTAAAEYPPSPRTCT